MTVRCADCGRPASVPLAPEGGGRPCPGCGRAHRLGAGALDGAGALVACAACGAGDLYSRKAFPKWIGIGIVGIAAAATLALAQDGRVPPWAVYSPLFLAAALDALLYVTTGDAVGCYRCRAVHFGVSPLRSLGPFDLEHAEELRLGRKVGSRPSGR